MYLDEHYETATGICVHRIGADVVEPPGFTIDRPRGSGDYDFLYFTTPVRILVDRARVETRPGAVVLYSPDSPQWYTGGARSFHHDWFHFDGGKAAEAVAGCGVPTDRVLYPRSPQFVSDTVRAMCLEVIQKPPCWDRAVAAHVNTLLVQLRRHLDPVGQPGRATSNALVHHRIRDARLAVLGAPEGRWTVGQMAKRCFLSRARFSALYREQFGVSPIEDVIRIRLQRARWLIENSTMAVKEVAQRVGFEDPAYFNRLFAKRMGVTPGKYR